MSWNLDFWRFVITVAIAKNGIWDTGHEKYYFHIGSFTNGTYTGYKLIILPLSISVGFV